MRSRDIYQHSSRSCAGSTSQQFLLLAAAFFSYKQNAIKLLLMYVGHYYDHYSGCSQFDHCLTFDPVKGQIFQTLFKLCHVCTQIEAYEGSKVKKITIRFVMPYFKRFIHVCQRSNSVHESQRSNAVW